MRPTSITLLSALLLVVAGRQTPDLPIKQISEDLFSCDSSNKLFNAICEVGLHKINTELETAGISITRDGVLFTFDDPTDRNIPTGHSCTRRARVQHQHLEARFSSSARLHLSGDSLIEPLAIKLSLPVHLSGRVSMVQRFGFRTPFGCSTTLTDHFAFVGALSTDADVVFGLSINPSLGMVQSGDYALVLEPKLALLSRLRNTNIRFRISGVNPISAVVAFFGGLSSSLLKSATAFLKGDSVSSILDNIIPHDIIYPLTIGVGSLPRPLEEAIFSRFIKIGERAVGNAVQGFGEGLEDKLKKDLAKAFKLDQEGKRVIIIKKDVVNLLRLGGVNTDVFVKQPEDPSKKCFAETQRGCIGSRGSLLPGCNEKFARCAALRAEHREKYRTRGLIGSKSKIERDMERKTPSPTRSPDTSTNWDKCIEQANRLCSACRGCSECVKRQRECRAAETKVTPTPPPTPSPKGKSSRDRCIEQANRLCSSCRGCSECVTRQKECRVLPQ